MQEKGQPKRITPQEFAERIRLQVQFRIAKLEAEFMEKARGASSAEFLDLIEDHCLRRFDVWALAAVPFAKSPTCIGVHPDYREALELAKARILTELSSYTRSIHPEWQEEMRARIVPRLDARCRSWWGDVGMAVLDSEPGPYLVCDDNDSGDG